MEAVLTHSERQCTASNTARDRRIKYAVHAHLPDRRLHLVPLHLLGAQGVPARNSAPDQDWRDEVLPQPEECETGNTAAESRPCRQVDGRLSSFDAEQGAGRASYQSWVGRQSFCQEVRGREGVEDCGGWWWYSPLPITAEATNTGAPGSTRKSAWAPFVLGFDVVAGVDMALVDE